MIPSSVVGYRKGHCIFGGQSDLEARTDELSKFTLTYVENGELNTGKTKNN